MSASASYSPLVSKLYTSRNVILEIMAHRGFATEEWTGSSINEVHLMYAHKTQDMLLENPTTGRKVYIQYHTGGRLAARHIYELIDDLYVEEETLSDEDETIIVTKDKMNDTQKRLLTQVYNQYGKFLNIFWLDDYLTNILHHDLVPPHRPLTKEETAQVLETYHLDDVKKLPEISRFDAVARTLGIRPGQVCEILRSSPTAITTKYYRLCL
ncbi:MAG: DNA-directed RNA polymerase subunit RpoH/Rpb5 C-terminal domain-containing protein [Dehalococcoidales bacterium]